MSRSRGTAVWVGVALLAALAFSPPGAGAGTAALDLSALLVDGLRFDADQTDRWSAGLVPVGDQWSAFGWGGDASVPATIGEDAAPWTVPVTIGLNYVQWQDPLRLPDLGDSFTVDDGVLGGAVNGGPSLGTTFAVMTIVAGGAIPLDMSGGLYQQWDFVLSIPGHDTWQPLSQFPDDTWNGGAFVSSLALDPSGWNLSFYSFADGRIVTNPLPGFALVSGDTILIGVQADPEIFTTPTLTGRLALDVKDAPFNPERSRVVTAPPVPLGPDAFFEYLADPGVLIPGFPNLLDLVDFVAFVDADGNLWFKIFPAVGWPGAPPSEFFSDFVQITFRSDGSEDPPTYVGFQTHAGVSETFSGVGETRGEAVPGFVMNDGALLFETGVAYSGGPLEVFVSSGFLPEENGLFQSDQTGTRVEESEIGASDDPTHFDDEFPVYDLTTGETVEPPVVATTTTTTGPESTTTTQPGTTTVTTYGTTTERPRFTTTGRGGTCWSCWGIVLLFVAVLLCILWTWLKTYEWWTCWLPWFLVIFIWVPFLLAGLWWWRPAWWWAPLLGWFPLIGGYTWFWARHRSWWKPWHLYLVAGYLGALVLGIRLVGAPEWGLLFPLFWVPWVAFYLGYRALRRPWWQPWLWGVAAAWVAWVFIWVIALTPWWAWWFPVAFFPLAGWWFVSQGYSWREIHGPKWCWVLPFAFLPFLTWWIPLWDPWWCFVVAFFVGATLFCSIFTHYEEEEWWTWWLPWFLVVFVWVPFLLAGLWFFRPVWWGWALVPWFLVIPGYALWWARRRSWWQLWMWYAVGGYLVAAAGAAYVVGAPEWGLLLPVFWLPWAGLYVWYRALRRPWWKPWMYLLFAAYAVWIVAWLGWLTPWWGWWFPVAFVPFLGWWFVDHGYDWALIRQKSCWVVPWCVLPWLSFMVALECVVGSGCCS